MTIIRCTCCQAELMAPQFYNGNPYGYKCVRKVDPAYKQSKVKYFSVDAFKIAQQAGTRFVLHVNYNGKWIQVVCYGSTASIQDRTSNTFMQEGVLFVAETALKTK